MSGGSDSDPGMGQRIAAGVQGVPIQSIPGEIRNHRLFEDLSEAHLAHLMGFARITSYNKAETVFVQGAPCEGLFVVLSGVVRLFKASQDGREHVVEVIRAGQSFAEAAVFADIPYPVHADALGPCRLVFLPKEPYLAFLRAHPENLFAMMATLSARMHQLVVKVERLTLSDALQRVAGYLLDMADAQQVVRLDVTKATLASQLGLTPETLSRSLSTLQAKGLIQMDGSHFTLQDVDALSSLK